MRRGEGRIVNALQVSLDSAEIVTFRALCCWNFHRFQCEHVHLGFGVAANIVAWSGESGSSWQLQTGRQQMVHLGRQHMPWAW